MRILFLDLASHSGLIACVDESVRSSVPVDHRIADHEVVPTMEECLKKAGWSYKDLEGIACVIGPGGFTSLRVAVSAANALVSTLSIPAAGIHLSDLYYPKFKLPRIAARAATRLYVQNSNFKDVWWIHSTKKTEVFLRGFEANASIVPEPTWMKLEDAVKHFKEGALWMGELIPEQLSLFEEAGAKPAELRPTVEVLAAFLLKQSFKKDILVPWYGRGW